MVKYVCSWTTRRCQERERGATCHRKARDIGRISTGYRMGTELIASSGPNGDEWGRQDFKLACPRLRAYPLCHASPESLPYNGRAHAWLGTRGVTFPALPGEFSCPYVGCSPHVSLLHFRLWPLASQASAAATAILPPSCTCVITPICLKGLAYSSPRSETIAASPGPWERRLTPQPGIHGGPRCSQPQFPGFCFGNPSLQGGGLPSLECFRPPGRGAGWTAHPDTPP